MVSKRRKQLIGAGIAALIVVGVAGFFARDVFAYTYYGGVTATAEGSGAMTGNDPSSINAQESYDLKANGTKLWEINKYPVNTTADITTNKGYLFVSRSELPANNVDGQQTSFSGGWGNPGFVEHVLLNGSQHMWLLQNLGGTNPFTDGNSDYIAFSDLNDMNGMYDTTPFNVVVNGQTQAFYEPQTAINLGNKPLPHITTPLLYTAPSGGSQVSSIALGNTYYLSPSMFTAYGFNGGGLYSQNYFAAYWVPIVNGQPDTSATTYAFSENDNGLKTVYDWPGTGTIINNGGLDSASSNPYGTGFMNDFELVSNSAAPSTGQLEVFLPGSFPSGTTSVDLVAYSGDGVQRYDAQIANFQVQAQPIPPSQTTCPNVSLSVSGSGQTGTLTISDPSNAALTLSASNGATLSKTSVSSSTTVSIDMPSGTPGQAESITVTAKDSSPADSSCPPATVSYGYTPPALNGLTLSGNPTSQTVGKGSTLTADYTGSTPIGSSPIVIHDLGGRYTLNNGGTTTYTGFDGQTTATTTALANSAYTESYDATVTLPSGQTVTSNTVSITWSATSTTPTTIPNSTGLTLVCQPETLPVGNATKCTATVAPNPTGGAAPSGEFVEIWDTTTDQYLGGAYTGTPDMQDAFTNQGETESFSVTYVSNSPGTQNFSAYLWYPGHSPIGWTP